MSMKNKDTWVYAHKISDKLWFVFGLMLLPVSVIILFLLLKMVGFGIDILIVMGVQLITLLSSIFLTEAALRAKYDKDCERKEK